MANGYAAMVRKRTKAKAKAPKGKRRRLDDYETPDEDTQRLCRFVKLRGPILEPAAGSGRMARALRRLSGRRVTTADIKRGQDFLKRKTKWRGDIVTNPPYRAGLADAFMEHALELADGRVAMLMELKYLTGSKRAKRLFNVCKPEIIIIIPGRIYFLVNGVPIKAQFFSHCWIVWPSRALRGQETRTEVVWAEDE